VGALRKRKEKHGAEQQQANGFHPYHLEKIA